MNELILMDKDFQILAVIDDFSSLAWNPRFIGVGDCQIECDIKYYDLIRQATYISKLGDTETCVIDIEQLAKDEIGGKTGIYKGKFLKQILDDRAIHEPMNFNDKTVEDVILGMIEVHFVDNKVFDKVTTVYTGKASNKITTQVTGGSVLEKIMKIEEEQQVSCNVVYDPLQDKIICTVDVGTDRSQAQDTNNWVIFSEDLENIYDYDYVKVRNCKNYVYVAGAGEGADRKIITVDIRHPEEDLKELYVDARDLQPTDDNGNPIPVAQYEQNLRQRGLEKLAEYTIVEEIEAKVNADGYQRDYFLGDIVDFVDNSKGIQATLPIAGVNESIENGERNIELIFGKERVGLKEAIKREVS